MEHTYYHKPGKCWSFYDIGISLAGKTIEADLTYKAFAELLYGLYRLRLS